MKRRIVGLVGLAAATLTILGPATQASAARAYLNGPFSSKAQCDQYRLESSYDHTSQCAQRSDSKWYFTGYILG